MTVPRYAHDEHGCVVDTSTGDRVLKGFDVVEELNGLAAAIERGRIELAEAKAEIEIRDQSFVARAVDHVIGLLVDAADQVYEQTTDSEEPAAILSADSYYHVALVLQRGLKNQTAAAQPGAN